MHMSTDDQKFKASFVNGLNRPDLPTAAIIKGNSAAPLFALIEIAAVEHAPPVPLYTIHHSLLI